jgi:hypothetical protein
MVVENQSDNLAEIIQSFCIAIFFKLASQRYDSPQKLGSIDNVKAYSRCSICCRIQDVKKIVFCGHLHDIFCSEIGNL